MLVGVSSEIFGLVGDYNEDGFVDSGDREVWEQLVGLDVELPNDVLGGTIGQAQLNQWKANFGHGTDRITGDFNKDGQYDVLDIDALMTEIVAGTNLAALDLNQDGLVDLGDRDDWLAEAAGINGLLESYLLGDANLDGGTDIADFNIWNAHKFQPGTDWLLADFDGDGNTDIADFNIWNAYKFTSAPVPATIIDSG